MVVLLTCKNEEDPIKNEGTRVLTRLYINFSDTQGCKDEVDPIKQRTNGPVNAHLYGLVKHKTYKTWKIYGKEMTLTFNTHIPS